MARNVVAQVVKGDGCQDVQGMPPWNDLGWQEMSNSKSVQQEGQQEGKEGQQEGKEGLKEGQEIE